MCQDENDEDIIWIAGGRNVGLIKFHKSEGVIKNYLLSHDLLGYNGIKCIESDGEGNMWIGTEVGLNKFNIENETVIITIGNNNLNVLATAVELVLAS